MSKLISNLLLHFLKLKAKKDVVKLSDYELKRFFVLSSQLNSINHLPKEQQLNYFIVRKYIYQECKKRGII